MLLRSCVYKKFMVAVSFMAVLSLLKTEAADAATYYVREGGGTITQCNGLTDVDYPGSGTNQDCAVNHLYWLHGLVNNPMVLQGGDTVIIGPGSYQFGFHGPNNNSTSRCGPSWPYDCNMVPLPSGTPESPTRILGKGWDNGCSNPPEIWGSERANYLFSLQESNNIELRCLDLTDHEDCVQYQGSDACQRGAVPTGEWVTGGIYAKDSDNVLLDKVQIHGFATYGIRAGRISNWELRDSIIRGNGFVGWDGDLNEDAGSSNSGDIRFVRTTIEYNGCSEDYPVRFSGANGISKCWSQNQGGYGDAIGTANTNGHWYFEDADVSHNVSDGIDLLYANTEGSLTILRGRFEGNGGNQIKSGFDTRIEDAKIIGNCAYFGGRDDLTWDGGGDRQRWAGDCRALGNSIAFSVVKPGQRMTLLNNTITGQGDVLLQSNGHVCNGSESIVGRNNIWVGGNQHFHDGYTDLYWAAGSNGNGEGACGSLQLQEQNSIVHNVKNSPCPGNELICQDPLFAGVQIGREIESNDPDNFDVRLTANSPAINLGMSLGEADALDNQRLDRGPGWDLGAFEYALCGNGLIDGGEACDDGAYNGLYGFCSSTCSLQDGVGDTDDNGNSTTPDDQPPAGQTGDQGGGVPPVPVVDSEYQLLASYSSARANAFSLPSSRLEFGNVYIFLYSETPVESVRFYLDDPTMSAPPLQSEFIAPYDLQGGESVRANPFNTRNLSRGNHMVTASVLRPDGSNTVVHALFFVGEDSTVCGDGIRGTTEQCDDGNNFSGDGCSISCRLEICGDGVLNAGEVCDGGLRPCITANGYDGTQSCVTDCSGYEQCSSNFRCGDGEIQNEEECDDGNTENNDGCSTACLIETGAPNREYSLMYSYVPERTNPQVLEGGVRSTRIYVFLGFLQPNIASVQFYVDDQDFARSPHRIERYAPYDLETSHGNLANPFYASSLTTGLHVISALVTRTDGTTATIHAPFYVDRGSSSSIDANRDDITVDQGSLANVTNVLENDSGDQLRVVYVESAVNGVAVLAQNNGHSLVVYTPQPGFIGNDQFDYIVQDRHGRVGRATVNVTVVGIADDCEGSFCQITPIPGRLEAENYIDGGEGVGYHDTTSGNSGGKYRSDDVDIERTADKEGQYNVGWIRSGEWLNYAVNVTQEGSYRLVFRVASPQSTPRSFHLKVDDIDVTGNIEFQPTGGWQSWDNVVISGVYLQAGRRQISVVMDSSRFNLNYIDFIRE